MAKAKPSNSVEAAALAVKKAQYAYDAAKSAALSAYDASKAADEALLEAGHDLESTKQSLIAAAMKAE